MTSPKNNFLSHDLRDDDIIHHEEEETAGGDSHFCNILYDEQSFDVWLRVADLIILFLVPMAIMMVLYGMMARKLWGKQVGFLYLESMF